MQGRVGQMKHRRVDCAALVAAAVCLLVVATACSGGASATTPTTTPTEAAASSSTSIAASGSPTPTDTPDVEMCLIDTSGRPLAREADGRCFDLLTKIFPNAEVLGDADRAVADAYAAYLNSTASKEAYEAALERYEFLRGLFDPSKPCPPGKNGSLLERTKNGDCADPARQRRSRPRSSMPRSPPPMQPRHTSRDALPKKRAKRLKPRSRRRLEARGTTASQRLDEPRG